MTLLIRSCVPAFPYSLFFPRLQGPTRSRWPTRSAARPRGGTIIKEAALRSRPTWCCGKHPALGGWAPAHQLRLIEEGHYLLPGSPTTPHEAQLGKDGLDAFLKYYERR